MRNSKVKGFTLVELIVVIAIIAILAAILVPNMLGYIRNSRFSQADANAKNVHTAATAAIAQAYADGRLGADSGDALQNVTKKKASKV
ncbi:MAG: prepilin-type N-terminal cleavage/methylation domain-containing protein, partial [Oscillospiraceae bacterium]|nr:prepilin-type N-terminal cleavage/methylation domain-containing protein [Oscillospiraceae bacterium]